MGSCTFYCKKNVTFYPLVCLIRGKQPWAPRRINNVSFVNQSRWESSQNWQQGRTYQGSHRACPCRTGTSRAPRHWGLGGGQEDRPCPRCHGNTLQLHGDIPGEKPLRSPSGLQQVRGTKRQKAQLRRKRHLGAAAKSAGEAPQLPAAARVRSGNFHTRCITSL